MWTHLEAVHVDMQPTYGSMYFPGEGLILAAGKVLFGCPWLGILIAGALMCAALCWMLQAWRPPGWALLGGILAMLRIGLFSYWTNTYTGAGVLGGLGGALVLGAMPRLMKTASIRHGILMAAGIVLLIYSRPYEGLLLCIPVAFVLAKWAFGGKNRPAPTVLLRRAALPIAVILAGCAWFGFYNYSAFGRATTLPYTVNRAAYAMAPYYIWQPPRPEPHYRHELMRRFYYEIELTAYDRIHSVSGYLPLNLQKILATILFFAGLALFPPIFLMRRVFVDKRMRFLVISVLILMAGNLIMIYMIPHYLAPFTAAFYALGLQAMRHLCFFKPEGRAMGRAWSGHRGHLCPHGRQSGSRRHPLGFRCPSGPPPSGKAHGSVRSTSASSAPKLKPASNKLPANSSCWSATAPIMPPATSGSTTAPTSMPPKSYGHGIWVRPIIGN